MEVKHKSQSLIKPFSKLKPHKSKSQAKKRNNEMLSKIKPFKLIYRSDHEFLMHEFIQLNQKCMTSITIHQLLFSE